jgi:FMN reductase
MKPKDLRIAALSGSIRPGSYTRMALTAALAGAAETGVSTSLIDLREFDLPFVASKKDFEHPEAVRLRAAVREAHGLILGTPEYHGGFSGVLKNALDLMGFEEFEGKIVGLVAVSGGAMGGSIALGGLRNTGRALHAWVVPDEAGVPEAWKVFDGEGSIKDARIEARLKNVGKQVARFTRLHRCEKALDFLHEWEKAPANPGGAL